MFVDSTRIIRCPEATVVDDEHTLRRKTCLVCPQKDVQQVLIRSELMSKPFAKLNE